MSKIVKLGIKNFRGIENLSLDFIPNEHLVCLIGRGDGGKTTILEAISAALSPSWNLTFHDTDFYNCNPNNSIEISASLIDFPEKLLSEEKYGLHVRGFDVESKELIDDPVLEELPEHLKPALTIKLLVDKTLEPQWVVTNSRFQKDKKISSADRAMLNCYMVSDYVDRHFSWNKGNPLYSLMKSFDADGTSGDNNVIIDSLRDAKSKIDEHKFEELQTVTDIIKNHAASLGLNLAETRTTLDFKELTIRDGRISLHESSVPFRLKGKGSKRLASFAIQSALVSNGGIMLVDEIEQGLEPDRIKHLIRALKETNSGQIFLTTHSREAVTEMDSKNLLLILKESGGSKIESRQLMGDNEGLQKVVRACPEAFFAKKVIVCEGATEIGICRALDKWRNAQSKGQMSFKDCAYVDGTGNTLIERVQNIRGAGLKTALFCDSDDTNVNSKKTDLINAGTSIFDCENTNNIEAQVFANLPWAGIKDLISYALIKHYNSDPSAIKSSIQSKYTNGTVPDNWQENESVELRQALAAAATVKDKEWFKRIDHGEEFGNIIFKHLDQMEPTAHLRTVLTNLSNWIDNGL